MTDYTKAQAVITKDGTYRLSLIREWRDIDSHDDANWYLNPKNKWQPRPVVFIMLNPSTADGEVDDATIRKCVKFAQRWKFERLEVVNLFSFRATDPQVMKAGVLEGGDHSANNRAIVDACSRAGLVVCAWGSHGRFTARDWEVMRLLKDTGFWTSPGSTSKIKALAINTDGTPKHPLYCKDDSVLVDMQWTMGTRL